MESQMLVWKKEKTIFYIWKQLASNLTKVLTNSDYMNAITFLYCEAREHPRYFLNVVGFFVCLFVFTILPMVIPSCSSHYYRHHHVVTCQNGPKNLLNIPRFLKLKQNQYSLKKIIILKKINYIGIFHKNKITMYFFLQKFSCDFCTNFINKQYICHDFHPKKGNHLKTLFN